MWFEAEYGGARDPGSYTLAYTYGRIEQDAVLSPFMFSDIPGSNLQLHMPNFAYVVAPNLTFDLTLHFTKRLDADPDANRNWLTRPHIAAIVRF